MKAVSALTRLSSLRLLPYAILPSVLPQAKWRLATSLCRESEVLCVREASHATMLSSFRLYWDLLVVKSCGATLWAPACL